MVYLGSILSTDGRIQSELNRRIGSGSQAFNELERLWKHANVCATKKLEVFEACVVSRLMYGLHTCWLNGAELSRLDAFYCKCLRRILKIPPSFVSRITNAEVYARAGKSLLRYKLLQQQLLLFSHVARLPNEDALRQCLIVRNDVRPASFNFRKRGGQKYCWINKIFEKAVEVAGGLVLLRDMIYTKAVWKRVVSRYILDLHAAN